MRFGSVNVMLHEIKKTVKLKNNNTSKRKRRKRKNRLASSKEWIINYSGKNIVKGYAKWYGVDLICAIKELRMNGVEIEVDYENEIKQSIERKKHARQINNKNRNKRKIDNQDEFSNDEFAFIAGFTSGGAPYGITHDEMIDIEKEDELNDEIEFN